MKVRNGFVTNSSSSSFVLSKREIGQKNIDYILDHFVKISAEKLRQLCEDVEVDRVYYLVDYSNDDEFMHIWVRRDESMYDDNIDDVLFDFDRDDIRPKFKFHY